MSEIACELKPMVEFAGVVTEHDAAVMGGSIVSDCKEVTPVSSAVSFLLFVPLSPPQWTGSSRNSFGAVPRLRKPCISASNYQKRKSRVVHYDIGYVAYKNFCAMESRAQFSFDGSCHTKPQLAYFRKKVSICVE